MERKGSHSHEINFKGWKMKNMKFWEICNKIDFKIHLHSSLDLLMILWIFWKIRRRKEKFCLSFNNFFLFSVLCFYDGFITFKTFFLKNFSLFTHLFIRFFFVFRGWIRFNLKLKNWNFILYNHKNKLQQIFWSVSSTLPENNNNNFSRSLSFTIIHSDDIQKVIDCVKSSRKIFLKHSLKLSK